MAASPRWKVYDSFNKYQASCHEVEAAATVASLYGPGATIRDGHGAKWTVWTEGPVDEGFDGFAGDSYDEVVYRIDRVLDEWTAKGKGGFINVNG